MSEYTQTLWALAEIATIFLFIGLVALIGAAVVWAVVRIVGGKL